MYFTDKKKNKLIRMLPKIACSFCLLCLFGLLFILLESGRSLSIKNGTAKSQMFSVQLTVS